MNMEELRWCPSQFGFTTGLSTENALTTAVYIVQQSNAKYVLGIFCDFKGAFDNLRWMPILEKLERIGCPDLPLWQSYFSNRRACIVGEAETVWIDVSRGCPQGSICGPTIWNLMLDDLLNDLNCDGTRLVAYADDILLLVEGHSRLEIERKGTALLAKIVDWGARVGVELSQSKTAAMLLKGSSKKKMSA